MKCNFIKQLAVLACMSFLASALAHAEENLPTQNNQNNNLKMEGPADKKAEEKPQEKIPSFNVFEFQIDGNTVLPKGKLEEAVYPFMGEAKTIDDIEKARVALEKVFQDAGYLTVSVSIPQQEVDAGVVKLLVTEGKVERLRVTDSKFTSLAEVKSRVTEFEEGKVPNFPVAQQQLTTVNRGQNRQVTPVLRAGKSPGKVEVDLKVQDKLPLHGNLELNDRYSPSTTKTRLNGSLRYENLWQKDHSIGISFQLSPQDFNEVKVLSGTYVIPRMNGDYFAAYGVISKSDISAVGDVNVIGNGYIAGARYIHPLPMVENYYHSVTAGADYKDFKESVNLLGSDGFKTPIAYTAFSLGYDGTYQAKTSQTQLNLALNLAPRGLGNNEREFADKRFLAKPNYAYIRADLKHTQKLPYEWSLQARLSGQLANDPLISAEQFAIGGADSVRGYLESSALGDNGLFTSLELRTPQFKQYFKGGLLKDNIKDLYAFTFIDAGYVSIYDPLPKQAKSSDLLSIGLGVKLKATKGIFTNLDYAHALRDSGEVKDGDDRLHFRIGYEW
ncbi:ShlB/FhaC/HecB family hemolysin secretion/activation protein [Methylotenera sp.]|uniref:ShlB/FhaC/HecB family hemolysin secretion/activation protein n=1 Tax=Methylotenera sp. TaxID=2051956 RepID=UPI00272F23F4|nr:ShlB/FhaC/HecB family hemolysin secretion/activation protein [Methylotenera sp.]